MSPSSSTALIRGCLFGGCHDKHVGAQLWPGWFIFARVSGSGTAGAGTDWLCGHLGEAAIDSGLLSLPPF